MAANFTVQNLTNYDLVVPKVGGSTTIAPWSRGTIDLDDAIAQRQLESYIAQGRASITGPVSSGATTVDLGTYAGYSGVGSPQNGSVVDLGAGHHSGVTTVTISNSNYTTDAGCELQVYVITGDTASIDGTWQIAPVSQPGGGQIDPSGSFDAYCDWFGSTAATVQTIFGILGRYVALRMRFASGTSPHADIAATMNVLS